MPDTSQLSPSQAHTLADLVEYASGAVVSRTLIKNNAGTVTLFAFDAGQGLSEHTTPFDALVQIIDGTVDFTIGGQGIQAVAGALVLMPANVPHALSATTKMKMLLTMLKSA